MTLLKMKLPFIDMFLYVQTPRTSYIDITKSNPFQFELSFRFVLPITENCWDKTVTTMNLELNLRARKQYFIIIYEWEMWKVFVGKYKIYVFCIIIVSF